MRVFFILDDTVFYHPKMVDSILNRGNDTWIGAALSKANPLEQYFKKHLFDLGLRSAALLSAKKYYLKLYSKVLSPLTNNPVTLEGVFKKYNVPYIFEDNVNSSKFLAYLRDIQTDVIVSSNSQIFKTELLSTPKIACINRHSGLLPSYGGILPVFQAVAHGEKETGVSVHHMVRGIDEGNVITQRAVEIKKGQTMSALYEKCFDISADLILDALDILRGDIPQPELPQRPKSYYSYPTKEHWRSFKKNGGAFI